MKTLTLDETANAIRSHRLILSYNNRNGIDLFTPGAKQPQHLKRSIYKHRQELINRMRAGSIELCPSPDRHRATWKYAGQNTYVCVLCKQLEPYIH